MKAIVIHELGGPEMLRLEEVEKPVPQAGEVLIKTVAAGINYADTMLRQGTYMVKPPLPFTPGFEVAGVVEAVGAGVTNWQAGARVMAKMRDGGYAEYAVAKERDVVPIPEGMDEGAATALLAQGLTALGLIKDLRAGETILIHAAAGGVGSLLVQLAKKRGARVLGTASSAEKLALVTSLGADVGINYTETDWFEQVLRATNGKGADLIIEMVGGEIGRQNLKCLAPLGTMIVYGAASGEDYQISPLGLLPKMQTVKGYTLMLESAENVAAYSQELSDLVSAGQLQVSVQTFPLAEAAAAHAAIEGRQTTGKVVLTV